MPVKLSTEDIRVIAAFERITRVHARDCLITERCVYFLVEPDKIGVAIGKDGSTIKEVHRMLNRPVKVFADAETAEALLKSIIPSATSIEVNDGIATVAVPSQEKVQVIGRGGANIKAVRELLERHFGLKNVRVK